MAAEEVIKNSEINDVQKKMMLKNIRRFKSHIGSAFNGTMYTNVETCGFVLLAPKGDRDFTQVVFHGKNVAKIYKCSFNIYRYTTELWSGDRLKYDILNSIRKEILGIKTSDKEAIPPSNKKKK